MTIGAGAYAGCSYCMMIGKYSNALDKMIYPDHRRFLSPDSNFRCDKDNFSNKGTNYLLPPLLKTTAFVKMANDIYAATEGARNRTLILQQSGCKGPYALQRAPYHERILNTPVDPMHVIKNIVDRFISLVDERILTKYEMKNRTVEDFIRLG